jgi:hypothetical protein
VHAASLSKDGYTKILRIMDADQVRSASETNYVSRIEIVTTRLAHDLRTRFPGIEVRLRASSDGVGCEVLDAGEPWGTVMFAEDLEDSFSPAELERFIAAVVTDVTDNLWPDEIVDPWPICATHGRHPMHPGVIGGRAVWHCLQDAGPVVRIGDLEGSDPS